MSQYIGEFTNINDVSYKVEITTEKNNTIHNITLGENPFETEMNSEEKNIYSPIKGSGATIEIVVDEYIFDLYSESPTGSKVKITDVTNNEIVWVGYITPQMFSQSFQLGLNTISVEAIDCISVLENMNYESANKEILTFEQILIKILSKVDVQNMYVSNNVQLNSSTGTETILDKLFISEMNFFDKKEDDENDSDVCWNCYDVISEICQFLGYVAVMVGQDLYLLDYDAINNGNAQYWKYNLKNTSSPTLQTITHTHKIIGTDHADSDANVSLDEIYNKVSVKADTFTYEDYTDGSGGDINITDMDNSNFSSSSGNGVIMDYIWGEVFPADDDQSKAIDVWVDVHNDNSTGGGGEHNYFDFVAMKFIKKPTSKFYLYDKNWNDITSNYSNKFISYPNISRNNGAIFVKYFTKNIEKTKVGKYSEIQALFQQFYREARNKNVDSGKYLDYILDKAGINTITWRDAIIMNNLQGTVRLPESEWYKYPYYEIECAGSLIQGGDKSAMLIQGNFYWHLIGNSDSTDCYPMEYSDFKLDKKNWIMPPEDMFIPASLQWGNLWWNGEDWQNTKCGFKLYWLDKQHRDDNRTISKSTTIHEWKCQQSVMRHTALTNTVNWRFGTDEEGCLITLPKSGTNLTGKPKLTLYRPQPARVWKSRKDYLNGDKTQGVRWAWCCVALSDFKFKAIMGDPSYSDANSTDTIYTNVLENDSIQELDTIDFKIHTFDDKDNSYGSVGVSGGSAFVNKLYNKALYNSEKSWYESTGSLANNGMRQEEHLIFKLCNQYTTPSKILECNLKLDTIKPFGLYTDTTLNGKFIVESVSYNYRMNKQNVRLVEKK